VQIPLTLTENPRFRTFSAKIVVALGNGRPLPFGFDTGSSGLHAFADAALDAPGSGVQCTHVPTSVTYGNPPRIIFSGVVCHAQLHFANLTTSMQVPVAYLTSASCPPNNPDCHIPDLHDPKAMGGYGVFGAGLTGIMSGNGRVPNPILTLGGQRGSVYNVILSRSGGTLVLGGSEPAGSAEFKLAPGNLPGERYALAQTCLFANAHPAGVCALVSFDTGNGVPWIHAASSGAIPVRDGFVAPGTLLGFAPPGAAAPVTTVDAGTEFYDAIKVVDIPSKAAITNTSIQAFFDHVFTYDDARGVIAVAPAR